VLERRKTRHAQRQDVLDAGRVVDIGHRRGERSSQIRGGILRQLGGAGEGAELPGRVLMVTGQRDHTLIRRGEPDALGAIGSRLLGEVGEELPDGPLGHRFADAQHHVF
jgi:hypothetical protein